MYAADTCVDNEPGPSEVSTEAWEMTRKVIHDQAKKEGGGNYVRGTLLT